MRLKSEPVAHEVGNDIQVEHPAQPPPIPYSTKPIVFRDAQSAGQVGRVQRNRFSTSVTGDEPSNIVNIGSGGNIIAIGSSSLAVISGAISARHPTVVSVGSYPSRARSTRVLPVIEIDDESSTDDDIPPICSPPERPSQNARSAASRGICKHGQAKLKGSDTPYHDDECASPNNETLSNEMEALSLANPQNRGPPAPTFPCPVDETQSKYYVVSRGRCVGVFDNWLLVQSLVTALPFDRRAFQVVNDFNKAKEMYMMLKSRNMVSVERLPGDDIDSLGPIANAMQ